MKTLIIEFPGWGFPVTDRNYPLQDFTQPPGIHQTSGDDWVISLPAGTAHDLEGGDFVMDLPEAPFLVPGVYLDFYFPNQVKAGVFVIASVSASGSIREVTCRLRDLSPAGFTWMLQNQGSVFVPAQGSFVFPYIPRAAVSDAVPALVERLAPLVPVEARDKLYEDVVTSWTTQLQSEVPLRGGIASSSGFTFTVLTPGRPSDQLEEGSLRPTPDYSQGLEVLLSQAKWTWQSDPTPGRVDGNDGMRLLGEEFDSGIGTVVQEYRAGIDPFSISYGDDDGRAVYWGNDYTDYIYSLGDTGAPESNLQAARVVRAAFGSYATTTTPTGAEPWSAPPYGIGRRVIMYVADQGPNPMIGAVKVYDGYLDAWGDGDASTSITWQVIDALSWIRASRRIAPVEPSLSDSLRNLRNVAASGFKRIIDNWDPYDTAVDVRFYRDGKEVGPNADPPDPADRPLFIEVGGYAFPHAGMVYHQDPSTLTFDGPIDYTYLVTMTEARPKPGDGSRFAALRPPTLAGIEAGFPLWTIRKLGIFVGDEDEEFDYRFESARDAGATQSVGYSPDLLTVTSGARSVNLESFGDLVLPTGHLVIPSYPGLAQNPPAGVSLTEGFSSVQQGNWNRNVQRYRSGDGTETSFVSVPQFKLATTMHCRFASTFTLEYAGEARPVHVFFPTGGTAASALMSGLNGELIPGRPHSLQTISVCSVAEVILQVLSSTGTYSFSSLTNDDQGRFRVASGVNGPFDVLPRQFGLGMPNHLFDSQQIWEYRIQPYSALVGSLDGSLGLPLSEVMLLNLAMTEDEAKDPAKWLEENVLEPLGLVLVADATGGLQVRTMDSFDAEYYDGTQFTVSIELEDLHVETHRAPVEVTLRSEARDLVQSFTVQSEDDTIRHYLSLAASRLGSVQDGLRSNRGLENSLIKMAPLKARQTSSASSSAKLLVPISRTAGLERSVMASWVPLLEPVTGPNIPLEFWQSPFATSTASTYQLGIIRSYFTVMRDDKVARWQSGRPEIRFEVTPDFPDVRRLTPGAQVQIQFPEVTNIDGGAGILGIVLITSVQHDLHSGVRIITGRVVAQEVPLPPLFGNRWASTLTADEDQSGVAGNELRVIELAEFPVAAHMVFLNMVSGTTGVRVRLLDEFLRELDEGVLESVTSSGVAEFASAVPTGTKYVVLKDVGTVGVDQAGEDVAYAFNAFFDPNWRWRDA